MNKEKKEEKKTETHTKTNKRNTLESYRNVKKKIV